MLELRISNSDRTTEVTVGCKAIVTMNPAESTVTALRIQGDMYDRCVIAINPEPNEAELAKARAAFHLLWFEFTGEPAIAFMRYAYVRVAAIKDKNDCASEKCSYFTHYLVYHDPTKHGPPILHTSFHIAEANCSHWQAIAAEHQDQGRSVPQSVEKQCCFWEAKIHA